MFSKFQLAKKYLTYYVSSANGRGHGIHSPFVFDFVKFVLNDHSRYPCYGKIEAVRKKMLKNKSIIKVEDFGAGSTVIKTNDREVGKIAASSLKPKKYGQLLYRISAYYKPRVILELGTSLGITTAYLASGNKQSTVSTLEGSPEIARLANENFSELSIRNISITTGNFKDTFPEILEKLGHVQLAFVDGNHRKLPTLQYFSALLKHSDEDSILIFDDIHWSKEMEDAWAEIKAHDAVTLTIDLFFIGIVLLKTDFKVKQHFSIRF